MIYKEKAKIESDERLVVRTHGLRRKKKKKQHSNVAQKSR
jgi:hypothetical protein